MATAKKNTKKSTGQKSDLKTPSVSTTQTIANNKKEGMTGKKDVKSEDENKCKNYTTKSSKSQNIRKSKKDNTASDLNDKKASISDRSKSCHKTQDNTASELQNKKASISDRSKSCHKTQDNTVSDLLVDETKKHEQFSINKTNTSRTKTISRCDNKQNSTFTISNQSTSSYIYNIPEFILDEISVRFLMQMSATEICNVERFFFILEEAHWFYIDNYQEVPVSLHNFCVQLLNHNKIEMDVFDSLKVFRSYKKSIKVFGCIIFDTDLESVLIVKENGKANNHGFPKGKKNKNEEGVDCAIREVREEIGYDVSKKIVRSFSINLFEKMNFYFVFNVKKITEFSSSMKNEIKNISWLKINKLEKGRLSKNFSIITKSYVLWRELYLTVYNYRFKFNRTRFVSLIQNKIV